VAFLLLLALQPGVIPGHENITATIEELPTQDNLLKLSLDDQGKTCFHLSRALCSGAIDKWISHQQPAAIFLFAFHGMRLLHKSVAKLID